MAVYDKEQKKGGTDLIPGDDELRHLTGIGHDEEQGIHKNAADGATDDILAREKQAAAGKAPDAGGWAHPDPQMMDRSAKVDAKSRDDLRDDENSIPFTQDPEYQNGKPSSSSPVRTFISKKGRNKYFAAALITSLLGGGAGFGLLGAASGPLQLIHLSETLTGNHLAVSDDQSDTRVTQLWRFARFYKKGTPQRTRLGYLGNKLADKAEVRLNSAGFKSLYNTPLFGFFNGYLVDTQALKGGVFDTMSEHDRSPEGFGDFMKKNFNINVEPVDGGQFGRYRIPPGELKGRGFSRLTRTVIKGTKTPRMSWISARYAGKRGGTSWHPIVEKFKNFAPKSIEFAKAWSDNRRNRTFNGTEAPDPNVTPDKGKDANGNPTNEDAPGAQEGKTAIDDLQKAAADAHAGTDEAKKILHDKIAGKLKTSASVLGVFEIVCLALVVFEDIEAQQFHNVQLTTMRVGMEMVSVGDTLESGTDLSLGGATTGEAAGKVLGNATTGFIRQVDLYGEKLYDEKTKTGVLEAESIQRGYGHEGGVATPEQIKLGTKDSALTKMFTYLTNGKSLSQLLDTTCHVVNNTFLNLVVSAALIATGVASIAGTIAGYAFSALALPVLIHFIEDMLSANEVDTDVLAGASLGSVADYGVKHFANNELMSDGGQELPAKEAAMLRNDSLEFEKQDFQSKSLAYRLFDAHDSRSFASQIIDQQAPDPTANTARYIGGFFNIGHTMASMFGKQLQLATGKANAAVLPYDYGFPTFGLSQADLDSEEFQNPFGNGEKVAAKLEAENVAAGSIASVGAVAGAAVEVAADNALAKRITACTGDPVELTQSKEGDWQWGIGQPVAGGIPTYPAYERGHPIGETHNYNCKDDSAEWRSVRSFIAYSKTMNSMACFELSTKDVAADAAKACGDSGFSTTNEGNQ